MEDQDVLAERFEAHRARLRAVAYQTLGSASEADDAIQEAWLRLSRPITVADLDRIPDDGRRYELLDGVLIVSPRPTTIHQFVATRLASMLDRDCPEGLCVVAEPAVQLGLRTEFD